MSHCHGQVTVDSQGRPVRGPKIITVHQKQTKLKIFISASRYCVDLRRFNVSVVEAEFIN